MREYDKTHVHFYGDEIPKMLEILLKNLDKFTIVDLGCGDGRLLYALHNKGLLKNAKRIVGVDISEERISRMKVNCPFAEGLVADVQDLREIPENSFDVAISNQVIEHVPDDSKMLDEIYRILKPNGKLYISTVIKKWYGFWIYYKNGFKLDPTHVREYKSEKEFLNLLKKHGFMVMDWKVNSVRYPLVDLMVRLGIKLGLVKPDVNFYEKHKTLGALRKFKVPVVGYQTIEVLCEVKV